MPFNNFNKKYLITSICFLSLILFAAWYTQPIIIYLYYYKIEPESQVVEIFNDRLNRIPQLITIKHSIPENWQRIDLGTLQFNLPLNKFTDTSSLEFRGMLGVKFDSKQEIFSVVVNEPIKIAYEKLGLDSAEIPKIDFEYQSKILHTTPKEISLFNSRNRNWEILANLIGKLRFHTQSDFNNQIYIVSNQNFNAVYERYKHENGYYNARVALFHTSNTLDPMLIFGKFDSETKLDEFVISVLGTVEISNKNLSFEATKVTFNKFTEKYKK